MIISQFLTLAAPPPYPETRLSVKGYKFGFAKLPSPIAWSLKAGLLSGQPGLAYASY